MIASRRWTMPTPPSIQTPEPSGPRGASDRAHALERVAIRPAVAPDLDAEAAHATQRGRAARPAAAATSASNSRGCGPRRSSVSACHCTPSTSRSPASSSMPSTVPSGAHATARRPAPSRSTAWWWNEFTHASSVPRIDASREPRVDVHVVRLLPPGCGLAVVDGVVGDRGQVLVQRAAARDVERLRAAADAEDRQPGGVGDPRDLELEQVERAAPSGRGRATGRRRTRSGRGPGRRTGTRRSAAPAATARRRRAAAAGRSGSAPARASARTYGMPRAISCWGGSPSGQRLRAFGPPHLGGRHPDQRSASHRARQATHRRPDR